MAMPDGDNVAQRRHQQLGEPPTGRRHDRTHDQRNASK
jgi:hypothetical protein